MKDKELENGVCKNLRFGLYLYRYLALVLLRLVFSTLILLNRNGYIIRTDSNHQLISMGQAPGAIEVSPSCLVILITYILLGNQKHVET